MGLLADFLHFGTRVFLLDVRLEQCVKEAVGSGKCEVWSVKFQFGVRRAQCEV